MYVPLMVSMFPRLLRSSLFNAVRSLRIVVGVGSLTLVEMDDRRERIRQNDALQCRYALVDIARYRVR